jgi:hypothetical protein
LLAELEFRFRLVFCSTSGSGTSVGGCMRR